MEYITKHCTGNSRYKSGQKITPTGVVLHSIGCPQPDASVLWKYWQTNSSSYMTHYVLDDKKIYECANDNLRCWHVCSPGNNKWIGIEMCEPNTIKYTGGATFKVTNRTAAREYCKKTYQNAVWLLAHLCKKYGWDPYKAVLTHHEVTTKKLSNTDHIDPQHLWDGLGLDYNLAKLRKDVAAAMKDSSFTPSTNVVETKGDNSKPVLKKGSSGSYVSDLQDELNKLGYDCGAVDGVFGTNTEKQVKKFQADYKLDVDGVVGEKTWAALDKAKKKNTSTEKADESFTPYIARVTSKSGLNVRKSPSTNSEIVNTVPRAGAYTIVEEDNGWGLLKSYQKNRNGWICLKYTEKV